MKMKVLTIFFFSLAFMLNGYSQSSILSSGNWYKLGVMESGIYKIDANTLNKLGINTSNIDPRNIAIYGNGGGGMLPQPNSTPRPSDLLENAILVSGESDGIFNNDDYILFYGNTPHKIAYDTLNNLFDYEINLYSDTLFYFLTIKNTVGKRIENKPNSATGGSVISTYKKFQFHEVDEFNQLRAGRRWFGERVFEGNNFNISFNTEGLQANSTIAFKYSLFAQSIGSSSFDIYVNNTLIINQMMERIPDAQYDKKGDIQDSILYINSSAISNISNGIDVEIIFNRAEGVSSNGYIDYLYLVTENELKLKDSKLLFRTTNTPTSSAIHISGASASTQIWDVSQLSEVALQPYELSSNKAQFGLENKNSTFYAFEGNEFPEPILKGSINNQNLHALAATDAIFITHQNFLTEANRLAEHRRAYDGLRVEVVLIDEIYHEYSSGMQDVTAIRDFVKYQYDTNGEQLKYVLLFGDASFDYKGRSLRETNFIPVYEARNSLELLRAYSSDDYYGFMDDDEGEWDELSGNHTLEIGIGRLPVKSLAEATTVVNKIIRYETSENAKGDWRKKIMFLADDEDSNIHQRDAERLADYILSTRSEFNIKKIYLDAYEQISTSSDNGQTITETSPQTRAALIKTLEDGVLMFNFIGHGNQSALLQEGVVDQQLISALTNRNKLPFLVMATCNFGVYDDPTRVSGGEEMMLHPNGGAIGLITSTRPVYSNSNFALNKAFYLAAMDKIAGEFPRLGDVIRVTKNNSLFEYNNRNYALVGDPSMRLSYPKYDLELTLSNGKSIENADTLKAQDLITIAGEVLNDFGGLAEDFTGVLSVEVFDKESEFRTFGNGVKAYPETYKRRDVLLFKGEASIVKGLFDFSFIVPKNISYVFGQGKVSMYAISDDNTIDATGANIDLMIGGSATPLTDNTPPEIEIFLDDTNFTSGQTVSQNPVLLAKLSDESGINISSEGFGKDIAFSMDGEESVVLNEYYSASLDTYKEGWIAFDLSDISIGSHTLTLSAYDINNNLAEQEIIFKVIEGNDIKLTDVFVSPNPIGTAQNASFNFSHDRKGEELLIMLQIINLQGRVIRQLSYRYDDSPAKIDKLEWNLKDAQGNRVTKGIYIYKLTVQSTLDGGKNVVNKKLIILN